VLELVGVGALMILQPCNKCWLKKCEHKDRVRSHLKGSGVMSARIKCADYFRPYPPGTRVEADFIIYEPSGYEDMAPIETTIAGTVMKTKDRKVYVWLDEELEHGYIVKLWPDRLTLLKEEPVNVCVCGKPEGKENSKDFWCDKCGVFIF